MQAVTLILEGEHNVEVKEQVLCTVVLSHAYVSVQVELYICAKQK